MNYLKYLRLSVLLTSAYLLLNAIIGAYLLVAEATLKNDVTVFETLLAMSSIVGAWYANKATKLYKIYIVKLTIYIYSNVVDSNIRHLQQIVRKSRYSIIFYTDISASF